MFIINYKYSDGFDKGWEMESVNFSHMNLCVGISGAGKTKILNTIYNLFFVSFNGALNDNGHWTVTFKISNSEDIYFWDLKVVNKSISYECLKKNDETIIDRNETDFIYNNNKLPQLDKSQSALKLLKDEEVFIRITKDFKNVVRRNFYDGELENQSSIVIFEENQFIQDPNLDLTELNNKNYVFPMIIRLSILANKSPDKWQLVQNTFLSLFPKFSRIFFSISPQSNNQKQIFVTENNEDIILNELSSGEKKALLIISDIITLPKNSIYLIDEIENSLGSNILDSLIEFIDDYKEDIQFIITSHHPYIINHIPYNEWKIVKREGKKVMIKDGKDLSDSFKLSKHDAFTKLNNMV